MDISFPDLEKRILKSWKRNKVFQKSINQRSKSSNFVFYEGPPTANGKPGIHHILSKAYKDVVCRYKTMQGFKVERKAGWDTHGLPVELEVEQKIGIKNKEDIEKYGIAKFNRLCKKSVWIYKQQWEKITERMGHWIDIDNPYITYETDYIETIWWIIKQIHQKGLLYKGHKIVPYCPRCGTTLSSHEVALGYKKVKENSIYIRFNILSPGWKNTSILSWTTTPWTLPGNVALAINQKANYLLVPDPKKKGHFLIVGQKSFENLVKTKFFSRTKNKVLKGPELVGLKYSPLFNIPQLKSLKSYKIYPADFINEKEGTEVVHTAVMYGEDDYNLGKKYELPTFHTVDQKGNFIEDIGNGLGGEYVKGKKSEFLILNHLKKKSLLFAEQMYEHDYPFCWRCKSPLLYYAKESWFIEMKKIKKDLIKNNQEINWIPKYLKNGRFGEWLREVKDWALSRERYWGTPLPIWECSKCGLQKAIGSKKDLFTERLNNNYHLLRHGESIRQIKDIAVCFPEKIHCPLTKKGRGQIKKSAQELNSQKIDIIFASDLLRTRETAQIVVKETGALLIFDKRLREFDVGIFNGKSPKLVHDYFKESLEMRFKKKIPGGENYSDVKKRTYSFLKEVDKNYSNKNILIVSHEAILSLMEAVAEGVSNKDFFNFRGKEKLNVAEFKKIKFRNVPYNEEMEIDFHRPYIDEIKFKCPECNGLMKRVPEVIDCWFDSGSMPFAQYHYPFKNKEKIIKKEQFPADFILEGIDQTRGWFYTLLAISTLIDLGPSYKNVISLGLVLDEKGEKMSKSKGNTVDPSLIIEKYGADAVRWYFYTINQPGDIKLFSENDINQTLRKFIMTLENCFSFLKLYGSKKHSLKISKNILDKWIISELNVLIKSVTEKMDKYDITGAARAIDFFVIENFSLWYIRRSRKRFRSSDLKDSQEVLITMEHVFFILSRLMAPFTPFISEDIYCQIVEKKNISVHLAEWPKADQKKIEEKLHQEMEKVRKITATALRERARLGIKIRQPLQKVEIKTILNKEMLHLIEEEINVKEVIYNNKIKKDIKLDTKITAILKEEGLVREIMRRIQEMRKKAGLKPKDEIIVRYSASQNINNILTRNKNLILKEAKIKELIAGEKLNKVFNIEQEFQIEQEKLWIAIKKV